MMELTDHLRQHLPSEKTFEHVLEITGKVHRQVKHRRTLEFDLGERHYFIKIHRGCGWYEILKDLSCGRLPIISARSEWEAIDRLHQLGIPTMTIAGRGERGANPAGRDSFLITDALEDMISLEYLTQDWGGLKGNQQWQLKLALLKEIARLARVFHGDGMNHRDFYLCHFLAPQQDWSQWKLGDKIGLHLIDLHRVQIRSEVPRRWLIKDLGALFYSAMDCELTRKDLLRFVRCYHGLPWKRLSRSDRAMWGAIWRYADKLYKGWHKRVPPVIKIPSATS